MATHKIKGNTIPGNPNVQILQLCNLQQKFKPLMENFSEYTDNTTIHGMKYLGWKKPRIEKIYWITIFVTCFVCLGFFIREIVLKWNHNFVILVEDDSSIPIHKIPFPAVTICPQVKLKKTEFTYNTFYKRHAERKVNVSAYEEYLKKFELAQQVCHYKTTSMIASMNGTTPNVGFLNKFHIELLHEISPKLKDMLNNIIPGLSLVTKNLQSSCGAYPISVENFSTILTNEGVCFTLNLLPQLIRIDYVQNEYLYYTASGNNRSQKSFRETEVSRIKINLSSNKSDMNSLCQPTYVGYKVILHSPEVYPNTFENFIAVNHESNTKIKVEPKMVMSLDSLRWYTPNQRQCFFRDERQLKFYTFYNRINCKLECFANYTLEYYGCVHFAFPRTPDTPICGQNINYFELYELVDSVDSLFDYIRGNDTDFADEVKSFYPYSCNCLTECNSIDYDYTMATETFQYDELLKEIVGVYNWSQPIDSPVEIEIFWKSPKFKGVIRKSLCSFTDIISQFGGILGLFMGASVLSFFEIIYFCVMRQFSGRTTRHTNGK